LPADRNGENSSQKALDIEQASASVTSSLLGDLKWTKGHQKYKTYAI
jgi:hypothetical protein